MQENLDKGFISVSSNCSFVLLVLFVKKANRILRFYIDFRKLNKITCKDLYPIPRINKLLSRLTKAVIFTKLDIRQVFNCIRIYKDSIDLTMFRTRYRVYKYNILPFGLTNSPAIYQRYINDILLDYLDDFCIAYLDNILIYSEDLLQHQEHILKVIDRLRDTGLQPDITKYKFGVTRTKYLGYILTTKGLEIDPEKVEPLRNWALPKTVTGIKSYLGFCSFYR